MSGDVTSGPVGIDLGTTYSAVAQVDASGRPKILPNRDGESITPSVVLFQGGQAMVGTVAKRSAAMAPDDCVQFAKRFMGDPDWSHLDSAGTIRRAEEISALILRRLAEDVEIVAGQTVRDVVITVPAYFDDTRRQATKDAAALAGLTVLRLINEPTAAAIAYGMDGGDAGRILVYDLGGGTFDVTVLERRGQELEVLATDGDRNLGGFDFDNALMVEVGGQVERDGGPDLLDGGAAEAEVREKCELAKRTLSTMKKASVFVSAGGRNHQVTVTRERFEELTEQLLFRTEALLGAVLEQAGLRWADIDRVLLVGGSTRMPMVARMVENVAGRVPDRGVHPDEAVALGAAVVAAMVGGTQTLDEDAPRSYQDVTSQGLGVVARSRRTHRDENSVIIARNSRIPCRASEVFQTVVRHQEEILVQVVVGDEPDLDLCVVIHQKAMALPPGLDLGAPIRITMAYDVDGIVHLEASLPGGGPGGADLFLGELELERPMNLDPSQLAQLKAGLDRVEVA